MVCNGRSTRGTCSAGSAEVARGRHCCGGITQTDKCRGLPAAAASRAGRPAADSTSRQNSCRDSGSRSSLGSTASSRATALAVPDRLARIADGVDAALAVRVVRTRGAADCWWRNKRLLPATRNRGNGTDVAHCDSIARLVVIVDEPGRRGRHVGRLHKAGIVALQTVHVWEAGRSICRVEETVACRPHRAA
jgi:hypothetical protein